MDIKRSTLYYQQKDNLDKKIKEADIKNKIKVISYKHPYYGYRRITAQLRREKVMVNHNLLNLLLLHSLWHYQPEKLIT